MDEQGSTPQPQLSSSAPPSASPWRWWASFLVAVAALAVISYQWIRGAIPPDKWWAGLAAVGAFLIPVSVLERLALGLWGALLDRLLPSRRDR